MAKKKAAKKAATRTTKKAIVTTVPKAEKFDFAAIMARIRKEREETEAKAKKQLRELAEELFLLGVESATVSYNGEGDSGDITDVYYKKIDGVTVPAAVTEKLRNVVWSLLPSGFENNDGGYGEVTLDCKENKVTTEHNQRIVEVESSSNEFDV